MAYTVLARKYRPQTFEDLAGQDHVSRTLSNAIAADRVAHAFLFTGARGVGKTTTARLLAKCLNCAQGPTPKPCNECDPCLEITAGTDLDVLEIDGASNNSVDDVRRLQETLPFRPTRDRFKIVIVDEVHMLSTGAFNAFLKTLEEPPPHVKFIFATTEIHKVPITIRSRCQRHDFRLIPHAVVATHVREILEKEGISADDEAVSIVAREAAGSLRDALTVLDQLLAFGGDGLKGEEVARGLGIAGRKHVLSVAEAVLGGDAASCLQAVHELGSQGLDMLHFARQLLGLSRDLVVLRVVGDDPSLVDLVEDERRQAMEIAGAHPAPQLERAFAGISKLVEEVAQSGNPRLALEMGLTRLADRPPLEPLAELLARLEALEARAGGGGGPRRGPSAARELRAPRSEPQRAGAGPAAPPARERQVRRQQGPAAPEPALQAPPQEAARAETPRGQARPPVPEPAPGPPVRDDGPPPVGELAGPPGDAGMGRGKGAGPGAGQGPMPAEWTRLVAFLHEAQPALGAVLEHGVPARIDAAKILISFPEGSFFGRQAASQSAREAIATAAERVLGQKPAVEVGFGVSTGATTMAAQQEQERSEQRKQTLEAALNHPSVKQAMDVFPEAEGNVDVHIEDP